jgi:hypothetical protein
VLQQVLVWQERHKRSEALPQRQADQTFAKFPYSFFSPLDEDTAIWIKAGYASRRSGH